MLRPRMDEQLDVVARLEAKLLSEFDLLRNELRYVEDGEDLSLEVQFKDRATVIKVILNLLYDLVSKDMSGLGIARKLYEGKLFKQLQELIKLNTDETGYLIEPFLPKCKLINFNY